VGVLSISFVTAFVMMTAWGRVDWAVPWLAFCRCTVAFVPMAIGAALGDILPGTGSPAATRAGLPTRQAITPRTTTGVARDAFNNR
jgi:hypothetical protein